MGRGVLALLPRYNLVLYEFCRRYVDRFNADNDADPWANGEYQFLTDYLSEQSTGIVFDVGANVGDWVAFSLSLNADLIYHCFEPSVPTFRALSARPFPSNVVLNNLGLGDADKTLELYVVGEASGMNSLYERRGVSAATPISKEIIRVTSLDLYCDARQIREIALLKIDVEGHEASVLHGAERMLREGAIRAIQFEYGGCNLDAGVSLGDLWALLTKFGYRMHKMYPEGLRHIDKYQQSLDSFKYSNWVATLA
jgi:FkbM family methyltransferase